MGLDFPVTTVWGDELDNLAEERLARGLGPQAPLPRLSWEDEIQKPEAQVYMHFMQEHNCYDAMATSSKLVIFDTGLEVSHSPCVFQDRADI